MSIDLVIFNESNEVIWSLGNKVSLNYTTAHLIEKKQLILNSKSDYILFWDANLSLPEENIIKAVTKEKGNMWHIGSKIGLKSIPYLLDAIQPTSMLHVNIDENINHTSWKNTFRGCLLEKRVFEEIQLSNYSNSLDIIGLDFGLKAIKSGVITRFSSVLSKNLNKQSLTISKRDELLFIRDNFDTKAFVWSYAVNLLTVNPILFFKVFGHKKKSLKTVFNSSHEDIDLKNNDVSVSIIIATLERYGYLEKELKELSKLDILPKEIIIVDQTPKEIRSKDFLSNFNHLPLKYIETDKIGQCSARNKGIEQASGTFIWFLDDDMEEIPANYLSKHLKTLYTFNADVSCGVPDEVGTNYIDRSISKVEISSGFPTNDVLVKKEILEKIGGFDIKMDQKQSEDQEIGLRCVKKGALSIKNNQLRIVHLRASRGGLRKHKVRKITFASSRNSLTQRRFLHHSEIYLNLKHFSKSQVVKSLFLSVRGTFIIRGSIFKKILKVLIGLVLLPNTVFRTNKNYNLAKKMLDD